MKINKINNLLFEKKLKANCTVLKDGAKYPCKIYEINTQEDSDYFKNNSINTNWDKSGFWLNMERNFNKYYPKQKTYVIEDDRECLGFIDTEINNKGQKIEYIESQPQNGKRGFKYIGETILAFLANEAQRYNIPKIYIDCWLEEAEGFYHKCGFEGGESDYSSFFIQNPNYGKIIEQNYRHTGEKIDYTF